MNNKPTPTPEGNGKPRAAYAARVYYTLGFGFLLVVLAVLAKTIDHTLITAAYWESLRVQPKEVLVNARRGNIYSDEGIALAISVPVYRIKIDFGADGFNDSIFLSKVDSLASALAEHFPYKSARSFSNEMRSANRLYRTKGKKYRSYYFFNNQYRIGHSDLLAVKKMPFISYRPSGKQLKAMRIKKFQTGFAYEKELRRKIPFGSMAARTIGNMDREGADSLQNTHGSSGLEFAFDSLLCGVPGVNVKRKIGPRNADIELRQPIPGHDLYTTINVRIQDIAERSLKEKLIESNADWGCVIVMDVKTGAIKALSNLQRKEEGVYHESVNYALTAQIDPGSTIKVASVVAMLEEGIVHPNDSFDTDNGVQIIRGKRMTDHNHDKGGYGRISLAEALQYSSNIGIAKAAIRTYDGRDTLFRTRLEQMSMLTPIKMELPGVGRAIIPPAKRWGPMSLPWIAHGYESMIPPIYTCRFYNAIANDGEMVEPYLISEIRHKNRVVERKEPKVINPQIASQSTLEATREMMRRVVTHGTAQKQALSPYVEIAGKTGTAKRMENGQYVGSNNVSFCGFFPYAKPEYTCMVMISYPKKGRSGLPALIVREIAEHIYATKLHTTIKKVEPDSTAHFQFAFYGGAQSSIKQSARLSGIAPIFPDGKDDWMIFVPLPDDSQPSFSRKPTAKNYLTPAEPEERSLPSLVGMAASDALYLAERNGYTVRIAGYGGHVKRQTIDSATRITLYLQ